MIRDGATQLESGDFAAALETFEGGLRLHPQVALVHIGHAEALIGLGRRGEALRGLSSTARDRQYPDKFRLEIDRALQRAGASGRVWQRGDVWPRWSTEVVMHTAKRQSMSEAEYLAFERTADGRHEFVDGRAWAMAGGSQRHALLAANTIWALRNHLKDGCRPVGSDQRVHMPSTSSLRLP